ncbi:LAMI_0C11078g1_1 [Lachancea mirantina]|uniref:LAMI_0C11078g1_1 n=1 Tax=Lachancea mirantina TaxID=1230905 RepID=A0A1G4J6M9_9SACH|nr:LAMI_0C11078g1_1 [Lachancea mirantina]
MKKSFALSAGPQRKRLRVRSACIPCRQRKRKCDNGKPCGMCSTFEYACHYDVDEGPSAPFVKKISHIGGDTRTRSSLAKPSTASDSSEVENLATSTQLKTDTGILDPSRSRYMSLNSAVAFPHSLGLELQSTNPPHLHSFAWNCGIRLEEKSDSYPHLTEFITKEDAQRYTDKFFSVVQPLFDILDVRDFRHSSEEYWGESGRGSEFGAVVGGVIALGSFFSDNEGHPRELDIVQYSKNVLEDPKFARSPTGEQVAGSLLRTIYLRCTTRPHTAWLSSCVTMHLAEATGLHHEIDKVEIASDNYSQTFSSDRARRLFWCAWSVNTIISYEYGRTNAPLREITCKPPKESNESYITQIVQLAQLIPQEISYQSSEAQIEVLLNAIANVQELPDVHPFLSLTKADLCHCFYRRLRLLRHQLDKSDVTKIISVGTKALSSGLELVQRNENWWNALGAVFQYNCILLAIDSPDSLSCVPAAKTTFDRIVEALRTHVAFEAKTTAEILLRDSIKKKRQEIEELESADQEESGLQWPSSPTINWDALLDPSNSFYSP